MHNLNSLVPSGWDIQSANAINDGGQILALGTFQGGPLDFVVLTPVPEPSSLLMLAGAAAAGVGMWRRGGTAKAL